MKTILLFSLFLLLSSCVTQYADIGKTVIIDRAHYKERLKGFWLGSSIANWTGLKTEMARQDAPFFTDEDWGTKQAQDGSVIEFVLDSDPWKADDDTDIEYIYQHALEKYNTTMLTGEQIAAEWTQHVALPKLWVSNLAALGQMQRGAIPPSTSLPKNNPMWDMIDAQLTTEIFGAFAPARPDVALTLSHLPIRTTAYLHAEWASEFYVIMHSLASLVDPALTRKEQVLWMAEQARERIPEWSYIADMYDFVKEEYENNPDKDNWEATRDKVYLRYQKSSHGGYVYKYPWDAGINFASSIISLLYGEGDFKRTIKIGALTGWDSDNPTATWGGLLGLLYGYEGLQKHFNKYDFADAYWIERTRFNLPIPTDSISDMAERGLNIIDKVVMAHMNGKVEGNTWRIPNAGLPINKVTKEETIVLWKTIEDTDPRWVYKGFTSVLEQWNASGASLAVGYENSSAEITFEGKALIYFAHTNAKGGSIRITLDGVDQGEFSLKSSVPHGQYYVKVFENLHLDNAVHTLKIEGDADNTEKNIDMLSIIPST